MSTSIASRAAMGPALLRMSSRAPQRSFSSALSSYKCIATLPQAARCSSTRAVGRSITVKAAAQAGGLPISMVGKKVFIAGVADDQGFGWAIAKAMAEAGAEISLGVWVPALKIFETSLRRGKFDEARTLSDGSLMEFSKIYPMDAVFDTPEDVPQETKDNKRYAGNAGYTVSEVAAAVEADFGKIDVVVHSLANGPEVKKPLLETSRSGYLAAMSASSYSFVSMLQRFGPIMNRGGSIVSLTYIASNAVIPGYGGGMSSAKAALEVRRSPRKPVRADSCSACPQHAGAPALHIMFQRLWSRCMLMHARTLNKLRSRLILGAFVCAVRHQGPCIRGRPEVWRARQHDFCRASRLARRTLHRLHRRHDQLLVRQRAHEEGAQSAGGRQRRRVPLLRPRLCCDWLCHVC